MEDPIKQYWHLKLDTVKQALEKNNFEVFLAASAEAARERVLTRLLPDLKPASISWGGSKTFIDSGLYAALKNNPDFHIIDTFDKAISPAEALERRRQALTADLFITGTNAVTDSGQLVNLDMIGNRVGAIGFGPRNVVLLVSRNKIVADIDDALYRIQNYTAPVNSMRLDKKNPCTRTGACQDCSGPDRICNTWTITEKCFPKGRIKVILINADMGI